MAETIGRAYIKILADGTGLDKSIEREMRKANRQAEKSGEDWGDRWGDGFDRSIMKQRQDIMKSVDKGFADADERARVLGKGFGDNFGKEIARRIRQQHPELEKRAGDLGERMGNAFLSDFAATGDKRFDFARRLQVALKDIRDEEEKTKGRTGGLSKAFNELGDAVGTAFGRGSRNNFLNFIGSFIGNIVRLPGLLAEVGTSLRNFKDDIAETFNEAGRGARGFFAALGEIAPKIGAAMLALPGFIALLGTATSALLLTAGAAAALAASIGFGLVGAIAPLVGLLGPLGLAAAGVATAFIGMDDAAKKTLKEAFAPLKEQLQALGDAARPGILDGLTKAAENLEAPMKRLEPLFKVIGDSVGQFIDTVSKVSFGPGFEAFVDTMTKTLPGTMQSLGTIAGQTLDGLMGLFATLQPFTDTFLDSLERISGAFADWSVSPEAGDFFTRAAESASALLDFLGPVWNLLSEILNAGKSAGDSLFRSMGENIQGWVDALKANPDILRNFFDDAKRFGEALGDVIESVGHLIDALDTPLHREWATDLIKTIGFLIDALADLIGLFDQLPGAIQLGIVAAGLMLVAFTKLKGGITGVISSLTDAETRMGTLGTAGKLAGGAAGLGTLVGSMIDAQQHGTDLSNVLTGTLGGALTGLMVGGPLGALIGGAAGGGLTALAGAFNDSKDAAEKLRDEISKPLTAHIDTTAVQNLLELLAKAHGNYRLIAQDAAGQAVEQAAGGLEKLQQAAQLTGLRKDTISAAFAGDPEAIKRVTDAMAGLNDTMQVGGDIVGTFSDAVTETNFAHLVGGADQAQREITDLNTAYDQGLIGAKQLAEGTQLLNDALADGTISGKEYGDILDFNRGITEQLTTNVNKQKDALQTLTNITGDAAQAQSILTQNNKEGAQALGITIDQIHKLPKKVQTDIGLNGAPETTRQAVQLLHKFGEFLKFKDIKAVISAPGIDLTRTQIQKLAAQAKLTPKQIRILLKTEGAPKAGRDLDGIKKKADDAGKKEPKVKINADTSDFDTQLSHVKSKMSNIPKESAKAKFDAETSAFDRKNQNVKDKINTLNKTTIKPTIDVNNQPALSGISSVQTGLNNLPSSKTVTITVRTVHVGGNANATAAGGIFYGAQNRLIGEAGPEAVVPLSRSLAQVDPAVRELSAIAQGFRSTAVARGIAQKTIDVGGIQIITPTKDPVAVANETVNRLVAVGFN